MNTHTLRATLTVTALLLLAPPAFTTPPPDPITPTVDESELSAHVHYLASPALNGRRALSRGSRQARAYIADRFRACNLKPWGDADDYEQPFSLGTNMVGVLPGADPALRDDFVLLAAHYDHVGKRRLGACDNASGVAALLETAECLSQAPTRCSVAFVVLDAEEWGMIGAYAFTRREDVRRARIRAVVNADMLGRRFLELLDNGLIVAGTEYYPQLRDALMAEAKSQGIEAYPAGLDLIGPRGDHAAFAFRSNDAGAAEPQPVFFFSCGAFRGYHTKDDRAENLDYALLTRSARLINGFVRHLADAEAMDPRKPLESPDPAELNLFLATGAEVLRRGEELGLTPEDREACEAWLHKARVGATSPSYTRDQRLALVKELPALGPAVQKLLAETLASGVDARPDEDSAYYARAMKDWLKRAAGATEMWSLYGPVFDEGYREFVNTLLDRRPVSLYLRGTSEMYSYEHGCTTDREIRFADLGKGRFSLDVFDVTTRVFAGVGSLGRGWLSCSVEGHCMMTGCEGTRDELLDMSLLFGVMCQPDEVYMRKTAVAAGLSRKEARDLVKRECSPEARANSGRIFCTVLERITGERHGSGLDDWLQWRLRQQGYPDREAWFSALVEGAQPHLSLPALAYLRRREDGVSSETLRKTCRRILDHPEARSGTKLAAFSLLAEDGHREGLRDLARYVADTTPTPREEFFTADKPFPFADHPVVRYGKPMGGRFAPAKKMPVAHTFGDVAFYQLKKATGQDFGRDTTAWLRFLDGDSPLKPDPSVQYRLPPPSHRRPYSYIWHWSAYGG